MGGFFQQLYLYCGKVLSVWETEYRDTESHSDQFNHVLPR